MRASQRCVLIALALLPLTSAFIPLAVPRAHWPGRRMSCPRAAEEKLPSLTETPPLKVGLMVEPTPFTHVSGYSNRYKEMLKYLNRAGDSVEIITADDTDNPPSEFEGFQIEYTSGFRFSLYPIISMSVDHELRGLKMIRRFKPDIVHVTTPGFMVLALGIYAKVFNLPLIMTYHTHLPVYARNYLGWFPFILPITWFTVKYIHQQADLTLVTSPQLKEEFEAHGIPRVEVWRKGIDTVSFNPKWKNDETRRLLTDGNPDDFLMVYIGRLGKEKRIEDLRAVLDQNPSVRLAIVGGGPYMKTLQEVFKGTKTVFTGTLSGQPLWEAFASGDVFCMPSDSETLGFVVLESLASGVPVIGARAGGIPDLIDEGDDTRTGYLVSPGDTEAMSSCMRELMADKEKLQSMGRRGRLEAERWSWEKATSVLRNEQYRAAMRRHRDVTSQRSLVMKIWDCVSFAIVGIVASTIVGVGSTLDAWLQAAISRVKAGWKRAFSSSSKTSAVADASQ